MLTKLIKVPTKTSERSTVVEWMEFLNNNLPAALETLEDEKMYVESIFSSRSHEGDYLYWYTVQDEGGASVRESKHWLDQKHLEYWDKCIDRSRQIQDLTHRVSMIPYRVTAAMHNHREKP